MPRVLVLFRVNDGEGYANRLKPRLIPRYGTARVVDSPVVPNPGDVVVALIGRSWLRAPGPDGGRALDDPNDPVRSVIEEAIKLKLTVVTVYLDKTPKPPPDLLPEPIRALLKFPTLDMSVGNFHQDADALIALLPA